MNITKDYIQAVTETTLDFYEQSNKQIDPDKELEIYYESIMDSKTSTIQVGMQINFVWTTKLNRGFTDNDRADNYLKIYSKDRLTSVIADISSILTDIDSAIIIK
jgi:hypothetical protein